MVTRAPELAKPEVVLHELQDSYPTGRSTLLLSTQADDLKTQIFFSWTDNDALSKEIAHWRDIRCAFRAQGTSPFVLPGLSSKTDLSTLNHQTLRRLVPNSCPWILKYGLRLHYQHPHCNISKTIDATLTNTRVTS